MQALELVAGDGNVQDPAKLGALLPAQQPTSPDPALATASTCMQQAPCKAFNHTPSPAPQRYGAATSRVAGFAVLPSAWRLSGSAAARPYSALKLAACTGLAAVR
jgi:hypothetical protein